MRDLIMSSWGNVQGLVPSDFKTATAAQPTSDPNTYDVDIKRDWCIGNVPQGGYLMGVLASTTSIYMKERHPQLNQPDIITANFDFLGRSVVGPGKVHLSILKKGRQYTTLIVRLVQGNSTTLHAIVNQGNIAREETSGGITLPTSYRFPQNAIKREETKIFTDVLLEGRPVLGKVQVLVAQEVGWHKPRGELGDSVYEQWVQWAPPPPPESSPSSQTQVGFDLAALTFLCDTWRPVPEQYNLHGKWYPTLNARVEIKKSPPPNGGWKFLYMRIEMKVVRNGRYDYECVVFEEGGDLVAVSNHTCLIVGQERNQKVKGAKI